MSLSEYLRHYWPFILFLIWIGYKFWNTIKVKRLLPELKKRNAAIIDVRTAGEFARDHFPGSTNIPLQEIKNRLNEIPQDVPLVLCCASGTRSAFARRILISNQFKEVYNIGSFRNLNS